MFLGIDLFGKKLLFVIFVWEEIIDLVEDLCWMSECVYYVGFDWFCSLIEVVV